MYIGGRISIMNNSKEEKSLFDRHLFRASAYQTVPQIKTTHRLKALIQGRCRVIIFLLKGESPTAILTRFKPYL